MWTVEDRSIWRGGFWNHLGHVFETCAVGNLKQELDHVEEINGDVEAGTAKAGQRHITIHLVRPAAPLPVDYLFFKSKGDMRGIIQGGRLDARRYLKDAGYLSASGVSTGKAASDEAG